MAIEIVGVATHPKNNNWRNVRYVEDGESKTAIVFSSAADDLKPGPLPEGWYTKMGDYGPILEPPKSARSGGFGGATAFRNTEAGFKFEQDQMNRRTSIMQAVASMALGSTDEEMLAIADTFYGWLKKG